MSFFGRKEISKLKNEISELKKELEINKLKNDKLRSENLQLNEKCSRYQSVLNQANKELRNNNDLIGVAPSVSNSIDECALLKEECANYKGKLDDAERQIANYRQERIKYHNRIEKLQADYEDLEELLNLKNASVEDNDENSICHIRNVVKKHSYFMEEIYCSKRDLFHSYRKGKKSCEYEMYKLLLNVIYDLKSENLINTEGQNIKLSLFAQVRLADIIELQ